MYRIDRRFRKKPGRMMGGLGSGRLSGSGRGKVEDCRSINVNRLQKEGCLRPGWSGIWQWTANGERVAWINLRASADCVTLSYRVGIGGDEWQDVNETVRIVRVPCRFGGSRSYFICPGIVNGVGCGRRVAKLYVASTYFLCGRCYRLAYASQREDRYDRASRRANKIRMRLGGEPGIGEAIPSRPKGMHRRTYKRLQSAVINAEILAEEGLVMLLGRMQRSDCRNERRSCARSRKEFWT